ncbi:MAG: CapA family protein [Myxococcales bacterium]
MARDDVTELLLGGDVMTGRGVDQALPFHCDPLLHEDYVRDARDYVMLAEMAHGPFRRPLGFSEVWGDALEELRRAAPDFRLINLETSATTSDDDWEGKGIHYRMHPSNVACLRAAGIQCCSLANNHVLDWGYQGLQDTLDCLAATGIRAAGAGLDAHEARAPVIHELAPGRRVLVFAMGHWTSGIPPEWAASAERPGVNLLSDLTPRTAAEVGERMLAARRPRDVVVASIHWGANWGLEVPPEEVDFAHSLIDCGAADVVHGHSSHHVKGIEVFRQKLVLYGCGDLLDDYEGIRGHEEYRGDLGLMYFAELEPASGRLRRLEMVPTTVRRFRIARADVAGTLWLRDTLNWEGRRFGTSVGLTPDGRLVLAWEQHGSERCANGMSSSPSAGR